MENIIKTFITYKMINNDVIVGDIVVRKHENNNYYLGGICIIPEYQNFCIATAITFSPFTNKHASEAMRTIS